MLTFCSKSEAKAVYLLQNESAPFSGYLLDGETQNKAQIAMRQVEEYKKLEEINQKLINEQKNQIENNQQMKWLYFIGGAVVGYAIKR